MADLGAKREEVHDEAARVLRFWFEELSEEQHWVKSVTLDEAIALLRTAVNPEAAI